MKSAFQDLVELKHPSLVTESTLNTSRHWKWISTLFSSILISEIKRFKSMRDLNSTENTNEVKFTEPPGLKITAVTCRSDTKSQMTTEPEEETSATGDWRTSSWTDASTTVLGTFHGPLGSTARNSLWWSNHKPGNTQDTSLLFCANTVPSSLLVKEQFSDEGPGPSDSFTIGLQIPHVRVWDTGTPCTDHPCS